MSWAVGYDSTWHRDIGYGVPATCDYPVCGADIDRGLAYVCGGEPYGGDRGCGLFFCGEHLYLGSKEDVPFVCTRCRLGGEPYRPSPDKDEWIAHKLSHDSWQQWRDENPDQVAALQGAS